MSEDLEPRRRNDTLVNTILLYNKIKSLEEEMKQVGFYCSKCLAARSQKPPHFSTSLS